MSSINQILNDSLMEVALSESDSTKVYKTKDGGHATESWIKKNKMPADNSISHERLAALEKRGLGESPSSKLTSNPPGIDPDKHGPRGEIKPGDFPGNKKGWFDQFNTDNPNAGKYALAGTAALGAGLGAVALAKKLRARKEAAKAKK